MHEELKILLEENCNNCPKFTTDNVNEFIKLWCDHLKNLVDQVSLMKMIKILTNIIIIDERNKDINKLIKYAIK